MHDVVKTDGMLGNTQTDRTRFAACPAPFGFSRIDGPALARIDRLTMLDLSSFAFLLQLGFGAETQLRFAFLQQALGVLLVDSQTVRLTIGSVRPIHVGAFVPVQSKPFEVGNELIFETSLAALDVSIFNA
jgi:hypothetical protein